MAVSVDGVPRYRVAVSTGRAGYGTPLAAIHFANYSRAVERATKTGGEVVKITIEHPGVLRDMGDVISTRLISVEHA
jgi:hypothetical protein